MQPTGQSLKIRSYSSSETLPDAPPHGVELWWVPLDGQTLEFGVTLLSADEQARAARFYAGRDRRRYQAARAVLRILLGRYLRQPPERVLFTYSRYSKPFLPENPLYFNIAHSGDLALMAFYATAPVGVDVEQHVPIAEWRELMPLVYTVAEQAWLLAQPTPYTTTFYTLWTRKEAFLKARGDGFSGDPRQVTLLPDTRGTIVPIPPNADGRNWQVQDIPAPTGYSAALCFQC